MKSLLCIFLLLNAFIACSQNQFPKGYIVKNNADTSRGYLQTTMEEKYTNEVFFSMTPGNFEKLTPSAIRAFGFEDGNTYQTVQYTDPRDTITPKTHFAKLLMAGTNNLYSFLKHEIRYFIVINTDTAYLLYKDVRSPIGDVTAKGNYMNMLFFLGQICGKDQYDINRINYGERGMVSFFTELEKCGGSKVAVKNYYIKSKNETHFFVYGAGTYSKNYSAAMAQAIFRFTSPAISKKTSINIGFSYTHDKQLVRYTILTRRDEYTRIRDYFEIPLTIQYNLFKGPVQPYFNGGFAGSYFDRTPFPGVGTQKTKYLILSFIACAGIEATIAKKIMLKADWRVDFGSPPHVPVIGIAYWIK